MTSRRASVIVTVAVSLGLLTVFVTGSLPASAQEAASSSTSPTWAYGAVKTADFSGSGGTVLDGYTYSGSATWGFAVIVNETNLSDSNYSLAVTRTMGVLLDVKYCRPDCSHPTATLTVTHHAWEEENVTSTLTIDGSVNESGGAVPALALTSSQVQLTGQIRESADYTLAGVLNASKSLDVNLTADDSLSFSPSLGLLPLALAPGATWYSESTYTSDGNYAWAIYDQVAYMGMIAPYARTGGGPLSGSGSINLSGSDTNPTVSLGGSSYAQVNYTEVGPFVLREGFVLIPESVDLFGSGQPWSANETGNTTITFPTADVSDRGFADGHLGFVASGMWWDSLALDFSSGGLITPPLTPALSGFAPAPAASPGGAEFVQGEPESPSQAGGNQACLTSGSGCPPAASPRGPLGRLIVPILGVGVVAVLVAALVTRRRLPPPAYPNASLYPPGQASSPIPRAGSIPSRPPEKPPPAEEDPLSHLW
jgi:hypothetical protein